VQFRHDEKEGNRRHFRGYHEHSEKEVIENLFPRKFEFRKTVSRSQGQNKAGHYGHNHHYKGIENRAVQGKSVLGHRISQKYILDILKIQKRIGDNPVEYIPVRHIDYFRVRLEARQDNHHEGNDDEGKKRA
jgi:hypothetical protein